MSPGTRRVALHGTALAIAAAPLVALAVRAATGDLGANPIEELSHATGEWSLRLLLLTLAVTPLRRLLGWAWLAPVRRTLGLATFAWVCMHFSVWVVLDQFFDWRAMLEDVAERRYITVGFAGFLCLLPLAVTSTRAMMRRLGRRWVTLHRLAYVAGVCGVVHYLWQVKADVGPPLAHAGVLALLFAARFRIRRGSGPTTPRPEASRPGAAASAGPGAARSRGPSGSAARSR